MPDRTATYAAPPGRAAYTPRSRSGRRTPTCPGRRSTAGTPEREARLLPAILWSGRGADPSRRLVLTPGVERVVHGCLQLDLSMILGAMQKSEPVRDRGETSSFR